MCYSRLLYMMLTLPFHIIILQYLSEMNSRHQDRIEMLEREIEQLKNLQRISESAVSQVRTSYAVSLKMLADIFCLLQSCMILAQDCGREPPRAATLC